MSKERIQKLLSRCGVDSRRAIECYIREGRLLVDGEPASLGQSVDLSQNFSLDGKKLNLQDTSTTEWLIYYKPLGEICSRKDPDDRPSIFDALPQPRTGRWVSIGRLDFNTTGLLLLTNDGEQANKWMHPRYEKLREYHVRAFGRVDKSCVQRLLDGVELDDGWAAFESVKPLHGEISDSSDSSSASAETSEEDYEIAVKNRWFEVSCRIGRYRIVRRLWEAQGIQVNRLIRTRFGGVVLPLDMQPGEYRYVDAKDIKEK